MLTYPELLTQFRKDLSHVVTQYQTRLKEKKKPISPHRATDIAGLVDEIDNPEHDDEILKTNLTQLISKFQTGLKIFKFWVYSTGDSTLAEGVLLILQKGNYSENAFLRARIVELALQVHELKSTKPVILPKEEGALALALTEAQKTIAELSEDKAELIQKNQALQAEVRKLQQTNHLLFDTNRELREENRQLRCRIEAGEDGNPENEPPMSPSSTIHRSFESYAHFNFNKS